MVHVEIRACRLAEHRRTVQTMELRLVNFSDQVGHVIAVYTTVRQNTYETGMQGSAQAGKSSSSKYEAPNAYSRNPNGQ